MREPATERSALVSIVIPAFNAARFIPETIRSVLAQTHRNLEVIAVDDGSTDDTRDVLRTFCAMDDRIRLIEQANAGVSAARNAGARLARGTFIGFLDADDTMPPGAVEAIVLRFASDDSFGLVQSDHKTMDVDSVKGDVIYSFPKEGWVLDDLLLLAEGTSIFCVGSWLVKREIFQQSGGFDPQLSNGADHEFYFRIGKLCKIGRVPEVGFYYRMHATNMHSNVALLERDVLQAYGKADELRLFKSFWFKRKCYANLYSVLAGSWWKCGGSKARGGLFILRALIAYPPVFVRLLRKFIRLP